MHQASRLSTDCPSMATDARSNAKEAVGAKTYCPRSKQELVQVSKCNCVIVYLLEEHCLLEENMCFFYFNVYVFVIFSMHHRLCSTYVNPHLWHCQTQLLR